MITFRASAMPLAMKCAEGLWRVQDGDMVVKTMSEQAAQEGRALHDFAAGMGRYEYAEADDEILARLGTQYAVDAEGLRWPISVVRRFFEEYGEKLPERTIEARITHKVEHKGVEFEVTGQTDLSSVVRADNGKGVVVTDYKSTRLAMADYSDQMMAYLMLHAWDDVEMKWGQYIIVYLRDRTIEVSPVFSIQQIAAWEARFTERVLEWERNHFMPGAWCGYCPIFWTCPGATAVVVKTMQDLMAVRDTTSPMAPAILVEMYQMVPMVEGMCEAFRATVKGAAIANGGMLEGANGTLALTTDPVETIVAERAWEMLKELLSDAALSRSVKVVKGDFMKEIAAKAPRGMKQKVKDEVMTRLMEAEAVDVSQRTTLRFKGKKEKDYADTGTEAGSKQLRGGECEGAEVSGGGKGAESAAGAGGSDA